MHCPRCGKDLVTKDGEKFCSFCGASLVLPPSHQDISSSLEQPRSAGEGSSWHSPWEDQENLGFAQGLLITLKQSLFSPATFFSRLPKKGGYQNPMLYGVIVETIGALLGFLAGMVVENPLASHGKLTGHVSVLVAVLIPLFVLVGILVGTVVLHVSLFLVGALNEDFEATFRIVTYSSGPDLFNGIPVIGWLIALAWKIVITVVAVREIQRISTVHATVAVVLPLFVCCGVSFAAVLSLIVFTSGLVS